MADREIEVETAITSYLSQPYQRVIIPEEDGTFRGEIFEFPGCIAVGESNSDTLAMLEEVAADWLRIAIENNQTILPPIESSEYSGKLVLRISRSLHKRAALLAQRDGVSLNQYIVTALATSVGATSSMLQSALVKPESRFANYDQARGSSSNTVFRGLEHSNVHDFQQVRRRQA